MNPSGQVVRRDCGEVVCYQTIDPGFAPTFFLAANVRYNFTPRIGAAIVGRYQFDASPWTLPRERLELPPAMRDEPPRIVTLEERSSNPFANLLLMGRLYYAFTPHGFATSGFVASAFGGGGVGQIEPRPALPSTEIRSGAHVLSGYGNVHAGARVEYAVRNGFHAGAEVALQFMFPTFLFNIDTTVFLGFHL
nr:hypothetical protein [Deltaproteobacteria bacterium]